MKELRLSVPEMQELQYLMDKDYEERRLLLHNLKGFVDPEYLSTAESIRDFHLEIMRKIAAANIGSTSWKRIV